MRRKISLLFVVLIALALTGSALALAPMGPPTAGLKTGQFRAGADYSYSNMDFKIDWGDGFNTAKDIKTNMIFANIGYGLTDDWEGFVRLGAANAKTEYYEGDGGHTGDYKFAWGLGTKYTFLKQENLNWGVLFQIGWLKSEYKDSGTVNTTTWDEPYTLDVYDIEIALGPTWKVAEGLSIYGGPFFNIVRGNIDDDYSNSVGGSDSWSYDVKEKSIFGGYVGTQWDFMQNASVFGEFQFTGAGWTFGTGVGWKF
jgi:hypothetical protein